MRLLDDLTGYEFEDTMALVLEKQGYEDVQVAEKVADLGRDVVMYEPNADGPDTAVIVECKHTDVVSRPVIQKLDSAVSTYDHEGPKRGMIATTGRVTRPGQEYAEAVDIEIIDGRELRELADEVGMDIYNGRIEIICEKTLDPIHPDGPLGPVTSAISDIDNFEPDDLPDPETTLTLIPTIVGRLHAQRTFETGVGVVHRLDQRYVDVIDASRGGPKRMHASVQSLVVENLDKRIQLDEDRFAEVFDSVSIRRFGRTETEYRDWLADAAIARCTETVRYTGDNNVTYEKFCEPNASDISIRDFQAVFVPRIQAWVSLQGHEYALDWYNAGHRHVITDDTFHTCRVCVEHGELSGIIDIRGMLGVVSEVLTGTAYTYCPNCGRIACQKHVREERHSGEPVCTGCAVSNRFAGAKKYFFDQEAKSLFEQEYVDMAISERLKENKYGILGVSIGLIVILLVMFF